MKKLINKFKEKSYYDFAEAKKDLLIHDEAVKELARREEDYIGDCPFAEYMDGYQSYAHDLSAAETFEDLADVLNKYADIYDDGSLWKVEEF
jgi:hypothetical protein